MSNPKKQKNVTIGRELNNKEGTKKKEQQKVMTKLRKEGKELFKTRRNQNKTAKGRGRQGEIMIPPHKNRKKEGKESFIPLRPKKLCSECDTCDSKKCKIHVTYARED